MIFHPGQILEGAKGPTLGFLAPRTNWSAELTKSGTEWRLSTVVRRPSSVVCQQLFQIATSESPTVLNQSLPKLAHCYNSYPGKKCWKQNFEFWPPKILRGQKVKCWTLLKIATPPRAFNRCKPNLAQSKNT